MGAKKVGGKLLLQLRPGQGTERAINAETGVVEQAKQAIAGQGDNLIGGTVDACRVIKVQLNTHKPHAVHPCGVSRVAAGRQHAKSLALQLKGAFQTNTA